VSTFLELCRETAQESGTISGESQPPAVTGQTGRLADIVRWVRDGWNEIQNARASWKWMRAEFEEQITSAASRYDAVTDFGMDRFAEWIVFDENGNTTVTMFKTSLGATDERFLVYVPWDEFYGTFLLGTNRTRVDRPSRFTVDPQGQLTFWPTPDATYTVRGLYRKSPQVLAANTDIPEMPARFHKLIVYTALLKLGQYDEALNQYPLWLIECRRRQSELERDQMPGVSLPGPLA
jgi:hypothetical protein